MSLTELLLSASVVLTSTNLPSTGWTSFVAVEGEGVRGMVQADPNALLAADAITIRAGPPPLEVRCPGSFELLTPQGSVSWCIRLSSMPVDVLHHLVSRDWGLAPLGPARRLTPIPAARRNQQTCSANAMQRDGCARCYAPAWRSKIRSQCAGGLCRKAGWITSSRQLGSDTPDAAAGE